MSKYFTSAEEVLADKEVDHVAELIKLLPTLDAAEVGKALRYVLKREPQLKPLLKGRMSRRELAAIARRVPAAG